MSLVGKQYLDGKLIEIIDLGENMVVDAAGSVIADIMTVSSSLSSIASASGILDASNYTVQAISFGKDASGYRAHAHNTGNTLATPSFATDFIVRVVTFEDTSISSYHSSATAGYITELTVPLSSPYLLLPKAPSPQNTRLEQATTEPILAVGLGYDTGHHLNILMLKEVLGSFAGAELIGCYPASGGTDFAILSSFNDAHGSIYSGTFSGNFNTYGNMDASGFVRMIVSDPTTPGAQPLLGGAPASGLVVAADPDFSATGQVSYFVSVSGPDQGLAGCFGGIYQVGLWCYDIKAMLRRGTTPSFGSRWNKTTNPTRYKLFAKKTLLKDLTYINDVAGNAGYGAYRGIPSHTGLLLQWTITF